MYLYYYYFYSLLKAEATKAIKYEREVDDSLASAFTIRILYDIQCIGRGRASRRRARRSGWSVKCNSTESPAADIFMIATAYRNSELRSGDENARAPASRAFPEFIRLTYAGKMVNGLFRPRFIRGVIAEFIAGRYVQDRGKMDR